jgi:hypothetical protein
MPRVTWATRDDWLPHYRYTDPNGNVITYGDDRTWSGDGDGSYLNGMWTRANALRTFIMANGGANADRILIAGCGLGFLIETMRLVGFANVYGLDNSTWCQGKKATVNGGVVLVNADFTGSVNSLGNALQTATGGRTFSWLITESLLESFNDNEIGVILAQGPNLLGGQANNHIIHIVFTPPFNTPGLFNEKTMAQWKAMAPTHTWMNAEGYGVA